MQNVFVRDIPLHATKRLTHLVLVSSFPQVSSTNEVIGVITLSRTVSASPSRSRQPSESGSASGGGRARRRSGSPGNITSLYAERNNRKLSGECGVHKG